MQIRDLTLKGPVLQNSYMPSYITRKQSRMLLKVLPPPLATIVFKALVVTRQLQSFFMSLKVLWLLQFSETNWIMKKPKRSTQMQVLEL